MTETVIDVPSEPDSAAVAAQKKVVELSHAAFSSIGVMPIKCLEAEKASELMRYLDNVYVAECKKLDNLIATEMLGKPVDVNGSVIRLASQEGSH